MFYVFDVTKLTGTVLPFRVPELVAKLICRMSSRPLDYAPTPEGY